MGPFWIYQLKAICLMRDGKNNALHELIIFVGSSLSQGDFFFLKSGIKWAFSYILDSCNIPQRSEQPQKVSNARHPYLRIEMSKIAIAIYLHM